MKEVTSYLLKIKTYLWFGKQKQENLKFKLVCASKNTQELEVWLRGRRTAYRLPSEE